jgi:phosphoglycolate phosphatase-like HAD superfamily hydrolase
MIRAFVFDLDGTLVETEELKAFSYARAAAELRPDLNEAEVIEAFKDLVGLSPQEVAAGFSARRFMRDPHKSRTRELAQRGAELTSGDLDDPDKPRCQEVRSTKANARETWLRVRGMVLGSTCAPGKCCGDQPESPSSASRPAFAKGR